MLKGKAAALCSYALPQALEMHSPSAMHVLALFSAERLLPVTSSLRPSNVPCTAKEWGHTCSLCRQLSVWTG
jgi:hypothetical protein